MILMTDTVVTRGSGAVGSLVPRVFCVHACCTTQNGFYDSALRCDVRP